MRLKRAIVAGIAFICFFSVVMAPPLQAQYFRFGKNKVHYQDREWFYVQSEHFTVYFYEGGQYLADFTAKAAEDAYGQVSRLFQYQVSSTIPLIVYLSHADFAVTNAVDLPTYSEGIGGVTELFKNRIAIPFTGDYRDFRRVIHHELVHAVINDIYYGGSLQAVIQNNIQTRIPAWFNEGLAEYAAQGWDTQSDMYMREATLEDHLPPIEYLGGFYAYRGGQSVWDYIAEQYGDEKIGEILHRLRLSRSVATSIRRSTGLTIPELSIRWQKALREIYFPEVAARENIDDLARAVITRDQGLYNASPALSPLGDKLAFVTTTNGLFNIYLASANDGRIIRRLVEGQTSTAFESLRILTPGISWSPTGDKIAVAVRQGPSDAIAIIDVLTGDSHHIPLPQVEQILSVSWSPEGDRLALGAASGPQSDIYILTLGSNNLTNLTNDLFSDEEPSWSPDGKHIVFQSDRGKYLTVGTASRSTYDMYENLVTNLDLYSLDVSTKKLVHITSDDAWDERSPKYSPDGTQVLFISDRNGILNLFSVDLESETERPLTDLVVGVSQFALSADGQRAALVSLKDGVPSIYMLRNPLDSGDTPDTLRPSVWAERVGRDDILSSPALALAGRRLKQLNPYLRDATDGVPFATGKQRLEAPRIEFPLSGALTEVLPDSPLVEAQTDSDPLLNENAGMSLGDETTIVDSAAVQRVVDFRDYQFSSAFEEASEDLQPELEFLPIRAAKGSYVDANGNYVPRKYKLRFSPDIVYGSAGYDALYGVQGVTQMMFSDMLGNHRIIVATNLLLDLRNSDYVISYNYLPKRVDWTFSVFHVSRLLADFERSVPTYFRYRQFGTSLEASYPLSKFHRFDLQVSILGISQADITDVTRPTTTRALISPRITFTRDGTVPGFTYPSSGTRWAVSASGSAFSLTDEQIRFVTFLADIRKYYSFGRGNYTLALRGSGGTSLGSNKQIFYTSGVQNWINRDFDRQNGFPISDATDFVFATPLMPLRGFDINARNGTNFSLVNAEFRFPLIAALIPGPIPLLPLYNIKGQAFLDAGAVWGGTDDNRTLTLTRKDADGRTRFDDLLVGSGFGIRTFFLGYPVRLDFAWPFDGQSFGDRKTYLSVGFDF